MKTSRAMYAFFDFLNNNWLIKRTNALEFTHRAQCYFPIWSKFSNQKNSRTKLKMQITEEFTL